MTKKYCDICGKEITHNEELAAMQTQFVGGYEVEVYKMSNYFGCNRIDLCGGCDQKLKQIFSDFITETAEKGEEK